MASSTLESTVDEQIQHDIHATPENMSGSTPTNNDEECPLLNPEDTNQKVTAIASIIAVLLLGAIQPLCRAVQK